MQAMFEADSIPWGKRVTSLVDRMMDLTEVPFGDLGGMT
jgi:hypothetical protein